MGISNFFNGMWKPQGGFGRAGIRAENQLGIVSLGSTLDSNLYRDVKLEVLDAYYENRQYAHLLPWDITKSSTGAHIPIRQRQPRIRYAFAKTFSQRLASKLIGPTVFPTFKVEDSPDDQEFFKSIIRESKIKSAIIEPIRRMLSSSSVLVRFYLSGGAIKIEWFCSKYCYPVFQDNNELESVSIKYVFTDEKDKDSSGRPKQKWYRLDLLMDSEILYNNPEYKPNEEPVFSEVSRVDHNLGFVQAEWFKTADIPNSFDGYAITEDILDFIDEMNYSLSQSSHAVSYNQDPQLTFNKMDEDEMGALIRSSAKSWNLGREGKAEFLESDLAGVQRAIELRDKIRLNIQDITRILLLDPEKIVGNAQSAKAMETLYGPMMDFIDELRPMVDEPLKNMVLKMGLMTLIAGKQGISIPINIPDGYVPANLNIVLEWPPIFQQTMEDLTAKVSVASAAKVGGLISPLTATKFVAKDFGVDDPEAEAKAVADAQAAQAALNPFTGGF